MRGICEVYEVLNDSYTRVSHIGLGVVVVCLAIAGIGCARQSRKAFMFTGVGLLLTVLLFAVSMACWHYVNYLERAVLEMAPFYKSWEPVRVTPYCLTANWLSH
ncbi:hypothetical protein ANCDUO_03077 [Ancylostoma duodenale]|uniref:Uncharacterized protein n=1 Tax=Ancylostoma duodenale TaxID=51022 RepID=A0A0C2GYL2_9BILA|nr:hypothetical protein ANCDUO_03077 [Ancylostoma duodenale]